jgi:hypothetical protein
MYDSEAILNNVRICGGKIIPHTFKIRIAHAAETKKEVTIMVKEELPDYKEPLVIEVLTPLREVWYPEIEN